MKAATKHQHLRNHKSFTVYISTTHYVVPSSSSLLLPLQATETTMAGVRHWRQSCTQPRRALYHWAGFLPNHHTRTLIISKFPSLSPFIPHSPTQTHHSLPLQHFLHRSPKRHSKSGPTVDPGDENGRNTRSQKLLFRRRKFHDGSTAFNVLCLYRRVFRAPSSVS